MHPIHRQVFYRFLIIHIPWLCGSSSIIKVDAQVWPCLYAIIVLRFHELSLSFLHKFVGFLQHLSYGFCHADFFLENRRHVVYFYRRIHYIGICAHAELILKSDGVVRDFLLYLTAVIDVLKDSFLEEGVFHYASTLLIRIITAKIPS